MAIGANGVNGASVPKLAALARDIAPAHVIPQPRLEMEHTAPMMEVHAMKLESAMRVAATTQINYFELGTEEDGEREEDGEEEED